MHPARPAGFVFLAVCSLACAVVMAFVLGLGGGTPPIHFAMGATGALALVVAEALAFVRPWAFGASIAFGGTFIAMLVVVAMSNAAAMLRPVAIAGLFVLFALAIVYRGMDSLSTTAPAHRRRMP